MSKEQAKKDVINRLRTIKGHISGIEKMIEEDKPCDEVLLQVGAIKASIHKVGLLIMEEHAKECLINIEEGESVSKDKVEKVLNTIVKYVK
ncbi:DNA-binding transcriptional regulator, FrmR family [Geosporobacter subterraneus DSM 17957]|uniref:DNA-binding transcriptional regulator, FrmR family n=1 Tax=Geosporobacter subterraneus DSM 17957 TaxID=1121919 RepID=A0A1M6MGG2_9FIRM|nr:metal-sensitive transcriptional regulator [Geosporobacter subterraneus]SHJ82450.1 DNA-binding transcriptional regulator, FrmR family [Geosporobacter subterraneus DSM 17957]